MGAAKGQGSVPPAVIPVAVRRLLAYFERHGIELAVCGATGHHTPDEKEPREILATALDASMRRRPTPWLEEMNEE